MQWLPRALSSTCAEGFLVNCIFHSCDPCPLFPGRDALRCLAGSLALLSPPLSIKTAPSLSVIMHLCAVSARPPVAVVRDPPLNGSLARSVM